ncbi:hypothetical protein F4677DRAFT_82091 [Hypoxylon crocopeplum]|nr:hypothetical protein F4677DRAFT_82091 [Hypoxylon crocopeplum]
MDMGIGLEIPVFGASAASRAIELGASRIELNAKGSYSEGGLTPSIEDLERVTLVDVPVRIMIRSRGPLSNVRDFVYTDDEFGWMEAAIRRFKETGLLNVERGDGFVFGILKESSQSSNEEDTHAKRCWVDRDRCSRLVEVARPFKAVFHRAFDEIVSCDDDGRGVDDRHAWRMGLDDLLTCGFDSILTSGGLGNAIQNLAMLDKIITRAENLGIEIIVGGGVRRHNAKELSQQLKLKERVRSTFVHSACLSPSLGTEYADAEEVAAILSQLG